MAPGFAGSPMLTRNSFLYTVMAVAGLSGAAAAQGTNGSVGIERNALAIFGRQDVPCDELSSPGLRRLRNRLSPKLYRAFRFELGRLGPWVRAHPDMVPPIAHCIFTCSQDAGPHRVRVSSISRRGRYATAEIRIQHLRPGFSGADCSVLARFIRYDSAWLLNDVTYPSGSGLLKLLLRPDFERLPD